MKSFIIALVTAVFSAVAANAEINIGVAIPLDGDITGKACNIMEQRLKKAMSPMGVSSTQWGDFYAVPTLHILDEDIAETGMANVFRLKVDLTIAVTQLATGAQFGAETWELKGTGSTREKAILAAISSWRGGPKFEELIGESRERIEEYYIKNRQALVSKAMQCAANEQFDEGIAMLSNYPTNIEGSEVIMNHIEDIYRSMLRKDCSGTLERVRAAMATEDYDGASYLLSQLDGDTPCAGESRALSKEIYSRIKADEKEAYDREQAEIEREARERKEEREFYSQERKDERDHEYRMTTAKLKTEAETKRHKATMSAVSEVAKAYYSRTQSTNRDGYRVY